MHFFSEPIYALLDSFIHPISRAAQGTEVFVLCVALLCSVLGCALLRPTIAPQIGAVRTLFLHSASFPMSPCPRPLIEEGNRETCTPLFHSCRFIRRCPLTSACHRTNRWNVRGVVWQLSKYMIQFKEAAHYERKHNYDCTPYKKWDARDWGEPC